MYHLWHFLLVRKVIECSFGAYKIDKTIWILYGLKFGGPGQKTLPVEKHFANFRATSVTLIVYYFLL